MLATRDIPRMMVATPATMSESEVGERKGDQSQFWVGHDGHRAHRCEMKGNGR